MSEDGTVPVSLLDRIDYVLDYLPSLQGELVDIIELELGSNHLRALANEFEGLASWLDRAADELDEAYPEGLPDSTLEEEWGYSLPPGCDGCEGPWECFGPCSKIEEIELGKHAEEAMFEHLTANEEWSDRALGYNE